MNASLNNIKAFLKKIKDFLETIQACWHIAHDGTLHLANQLEIRVSAENWTLTAKTQVESTFSPKT